MTNNIIYTKLTTKAELSKAYEGDSGYDISASLESKTVRLQAGSWVIVKTGIKLNLPIGIEAQVRSRSGLAAKHGIFVLNSPGTIDPSYTGEIKVILMNLGKKDYYIKNGEKIAQICFAKISNWSLVDSQGVIIKPKFHQRDEKGLGSSNP
jgi:dUTP pyrophosphatase